MASIRLSSSDQVVAATLIMNGLEGYKQVGEVRIVSIQER